LSILAVPAWSADIEQAAKLLASDGAAGDVFGFAYAMDGDTAILGSFHDDDEGNGTGSAYVYVRNTGGGDCPLSSVDPRFGLHIDKDIEAGKNNVFLPNSIVLNDEKHKGVNQVVTVPPEPC